MLRLGRVGITANTDMNVKSNRKFGELLFNPNSCTFRIKKVRGSKNFDPFCNFLSESM